MDDFASRLGIIDIMFAVGEHLYNADIKFSYINDNTIHTNNILIEYIKHNCEIVVRKPLADFTNYPQNCGQNCGYIYMCYQIALSDPMLFDKIIKLLIGHK